MMRSGPLAVLAAVCAAASTSPASACSPLAYSYSGSPPALERNEARVLLDKAVRVDLVIAERSRPLDLQTVFGDVPAGLTPAEALGGEGDIAQWQPWAAVVSFRVLETLKGVPSEPAFDMAASATQDTETARSQRRNWARERRAFDDPSTYWSSDVHMLDETFMISACQEPPHVVVGGTYLIFRGERGNILGPTLPFRWRHSGQVFQIQGPVFEEVFGDDDPWLRRVRREAARLRSAP